MIAWLDTGLRQLAAELCRTYENYPDKSPEYIWLMQDLSRGEFKSVIPDVEFSDRYLRQYYIVIAEAPREYRWYFFVHYVSRKSRRAKMRALGTRHRDQFYNLRDQLHAYVLGACNFLEKKVSRTTHPDLMGYASIIPRNYA